VQQSFFTEQYEKGVEIKSYFGKNPIPQIMRETAELVSPPAVIFGEIELTEKYLTFVPSKTSRPLERKYIWAARVSSNESSVIYIYEKETNNKNRRVTTKKIGLANIRMVLSRSYNYVDSCFEIFTNTGKSYMFNVYEPELKKRIIQKIYDDRAKIPLLESLIFSLQRDADFLKYRYTEL